jgi:ABC-2 type transport system permease protein
MIDETIALTARALKKWVRNPAAIMPSIFTATFYLALFGSSFNPINLVPTQINGIQIPSTMIQLLKTAFRQSFGGAPTYITYLTAGVICLVLVFNMAFGGIDLVEDRQNGFLSTLLADPIPRASIYFSGVLQNLVKAAFLAILAFTIALFVPNGLKLPSSFGAVDLAGVFSAFILLAFALSCIFTALALSLRRIDSLVAVVNFLTLPLIFTSSALFPASSFPDWLKAIAEVNPISKASEAARLLIINGSLSASQLSTFTNDMVYLAVLAVVVAALGTLAAGRVLRAE